MPPDLAVFPEAQVSPPLSNGERQDDRMQTEFVAMLSHELRNPLQSMTMASQLLAAAAQTDAVVAQAHGVLDRQISHMSRLLDDLLDASRAVSGKIVLQLAPVSLGEIFQAAIEASQPGITARRQHLIVDLPDEAIVIDGDLVRLAQALTNLLGNASQFSDMGGVIAIGAVCRDAMVEVTVSDNGAGIAQELQPHVFDLFTQGNRTLERAPGGLGVGLALVKTIVSMHGGATALFSAGLDAGSSFTVSLPLGAVLALPPPLPAAPLDATFDVLIIEDNVDANEIMGMLLELEGHRVTNSFDGVEGLHRALEKRFDVVVCDLGLPGLTGLEVVAAIKAHYGGNAPLMIATTGYSEDAKRDLACAAGFDHYLVKPANVDSVLDAIAEHAR